MAHGGFRPGSGRKPKAQKFAEQTAAAEQAMANRLPDNVGTIQKLADGGQLGGSKKLKAAGLVMIGSGPRQRLAFPELPPEQLVIVEETIEIHEPNLQAAVYLTDRIMGKPVERIEADVSETQSWDDRLRVMPLDDLRRLLALIRKANAPGDPGA